jgi:hypothetical protein
MKLLLGVGGSELSYLALTETLERVSETGDELTIALFENEDIDTDLDTVQQRVQERINESGLELPLRHIDGTSPGSELVNIAESEGFGNSFINSSCHDLVYGFGGLATDNLAHMDKAVGHCLKYRLDFFQCARTAAYHHCQRPAMSAFYAHRYRRI